MRRALVVASLVACGVTAPAPTAVPAPPPTLPAAGAALTSARESITVDQPRGFARVTSPVTVRGTASVFEAALLWRVEDASGKELGRGTAQASAGAPARGSFTFSATFTVSADAYGYVVVFNTSARDGRVEDLVRVPVVLATR